MPMLSNVSDHDEDGDDILAEYENKDSDEDQVNVNKNEDIGSENEEETARRIDPTTSVKHVVRNPIPKLNTERLKGPKGIHTIEKYFEGFKFHGKGYEKLDLDRVMKRMEHWGHRLFPKLDFDDFLGKVEKLGTKKDLQVFIKKYRQDMLSADDNLTTPNDMDVEEDNEQDEPVDEFDILIAEQIEKQKQAMQQSTLSDTSINNEDTFNALLSQSNTTKNSQSANANSASSQLSDETKERIERNRQQAIQRRLSRLKKIEEAKKRKLEDTEDSQIENDSFITQISNTTQNSENKECEINSQIINENHES